MNNICLELFIHIIVLNNKLYKLLIQETNQPLIHIVKFLYNDGYASIDVSQECRDKYKELYKNLTIGIG
jgi:hypothetical protein